MYVLPNHVCKAITNTLGIHIITYFTISLKVCSASQKGSQKVKKAFPSQKGIPTSFKEIPEEIDEKAIVAPQNYVEACCQHIAFLAGRKTIDSEITRHVESNNIAFCCLNMFKLHTGDYDSSKMSNAAYTLALPGRILDLSTLLSNKKYRNRGNKDGALAAMKKLENDGLGKIKKKEAHRGASAVSNRNM